MGASGYGFGARIAFRGAAGRSCRTRRLALLKSMEKAAVLKEATTLDQAKTFVVGLIELSRQVFVAHDDQVSELTLAQLRVCGTLFHGPRPMSALSRELGVSQSAMTQIADRLERARLVQRIAASSACN